MKTENSVSIKTGSMLAMFEHIDALIRSWSVQIGSEEHRYPVLIPAEILRRAEYPDAFPHLVMAPAVSRDPNQEFADGNMRLSDWYLSPAVCYHAYAALERRTLDQGRIISARGGCFRNEEASALAVGRRQVEFEMRELIFVGAGEWVEERVKQLQPEVEGIARNLAIRGEWHPASDPFFLPRARGKAHIQRLQGTKLEYCLPDGLALASINRHGDFFGSRFEIRTANGETAHSACIAFGLDRWAAHLSPIQ